MISYEVSLFKKITETLHAKVSVEAETPEEARRIALAMAEGTKLEWLRYIGERQEDSSPAVDEIEAIVEV